MTTNYSTQLLEFFTRDLTLLKQELNAFTVEERMWHVDPKISNSAGNLALHLVGNLNHFVGTTIGNTGYIRDRDAEFARKGVSRAEINADVDKTIAMLKKVLGKLTNADLDKPFPVKKNNKEESTGHFLIHLFGHMNYHLGQINYHRRMLDKA